MPKMLIMTLATLVGTCGGVTLSSYEQGAKFEGCITISDWESKNLADEITVVDRGSDGCCPTGTVPGVEHYNNYVGAQVVCGFTSDGTTSFSTSSGSAQSCTYNQCYVWKQNLECSGGGRQFLNGCCAAPADCTGGSCGFKDQCENYAYSMTNVHSDSTKYCLTYHTNYQLENTVAKTDDQANDRLQVDDKLYYYTACAGGAGGTTGTEASLAARGVNDVGLVALLASMAFMV
jgi:hypothetical protein